MKRKMLVLVVGVVLLVMAVILGLVQIRSVDFFVYNIYGVAQNKWYFYSAVAISGIIGLFLVTWGLLKKDQRQTASTAVT